MKRKLIFTGIIFSFILSINGQVNKEINPPVIDVEYGLKNLSRLKTSFFGKTIRYIQLETTDDCLVGRDPIVKVLKNYIVIEFKSSFQDAGTCLLFRKEDGCFISKIGHGGQDPEAYTNCFSWTDDTEEFLYFHRTPNQLVKYDMKGNFCGKVEFATSKLASYYLITDSEIIGYYDSFDVLNKWSDQYLLGIYKKDGILKDTVPSFYPYTTPFTDDIYQTNLLSRYNFLYRNFGSWTRAGALIFDYTPARQIRQVNALYQARIWKNNDIIRVKQDFVDTIYTLSGSNIIPSFVFNSGKFYWPVQERRSEKNNNERIFIADIYENNTFIFFQCIKGMFSKPVLYNSLYNKKTGEVKMGKNSDGIEDDLNLFMPFVPLCMSTVGEFVSLVEVWEVKEWLEKHSNTLKNEKFSFLNNLDEEANPIVILIE